MVKEPFMKLMKRAAAFLLTAALGLSVLCGCQEETPAEAPAAVAPETLSVCLGAAPGTLDPAYATEPREQTLISNLYANLMRLTVDENGNTVPVPDMAKSYEEEKNVDGSVTYTFRLRSAKWSDGSAVIADDFVYAWKRLADPATGSPNAALLSMISGYDTVRSTGDVSALQVEAKNSSTLVVTITGTCEWFLTDVCASAAASPLRQSAAEQPANDTAQATEATGDTEAPAASESVDYTQLVTNGPYQVASADSTGMILEQNATYEETTRPGNIRVVYANTPEAGWALYEAGRVDFLAELPEAQLKQLALDPSWTPAADPTTCTLLFNTTHEVLADPLVREALQLAIDRTALSTAAGAGCTPASGLVSGSVPDPDANPATFRTHGGDLVVCDPALMASNRATANLRLIEAGYDQDFPLPELQLFYADNDRHAETARLLAEMWSSVLEITVTAVAMDEAALNTALTERQYAMAITNITAAANDAQCFLDRWTTSHPDNVTGYSNSAFDTLLTVIHGASDNDARRGCLHDAESLLLEDCPLTPLYFTGSAWAMRDTLTGLVRDGRGSFLFSDIVLVSAES